jgi:hypothetical protein
MKKALRLRREALTELGTSGLALVVGASHLCTQFCNFTNPCTHVGPTIDVCPTLPLDECLNLPQTT